ncbi:MAG: nucleotidyltransferase [Firmicutes bacterium]|nr:nucleotidyltransferase [Bacillota bacterium]
MTDKIYTVDEIRQYITPIAREYRVEKVYLFGSYARGDATEQSDLDFRIDQGKIRSYFVLEGLYNKLSDALSKPIDLVTTESLEPEFRDSIASEEVLLYAD